MSFHQLNVGRDDEILDPDLPIVDAHHHNFHRPALRYLFDDYQADVSAGHRIVASVYVETNAFSLPGGSEHLRPLGEIEFANGLAAMAASGRYGPARLCAAIVGYSDMRIGSRIGEFLDLALERAPGRFRGVRQVALDNGAEASFKFVPVRPPAGILVHPGTVPALRELARRGLSFDAAVFHHQLPELSALADQCPEVTFILNHCGQAELIGLDREGRERIFLDWKKNLTELARRPNIACKIGGLGLPFWGFGLEDRTDPIGYQELASLWRPYVESTIEAFGVNRCMMESDYPIDSRSAGFVPLWNALKFLTRGYREAERRALFCDNAARVYKIDLAGVV